MRTTLSPCSWLALLSRPPDAGKEAYWFLFLNNISFPGDHINHRYLKYHLCAKVFQSVFPIQVFLQCFKIVYFDISIWISLKHLKSNVSKTELPIFPHTQTCFFVFSFQPPSIQRIVILDLAFFPSSEFL